ncbi:MAG: DUF1294 domain-containing protein [Anaerolineaceae bacterium]|jgi:uncharacterized membrane protein YsdA (DUF1294 family)|nr:DUF1294 domain-containing protein [Anaerolineaceae bacterium]MDD4043581.1 DUF1294 domain-containing protein [Anaerolineaceae bacterium]MDD4578233.1 DUF1294 domain-containing protein [Anaerolineaceae bacterium]
MELLIIPISLLTFLLLGYDKSQARNHGWRVPEDVLLLLGILGGAIGGLIGMKVFHHKTRKNYFWIIYGLAAILHISILIYRRF